MWVIQRQGDDGTHTNDCYINLLNTLSFYIQCLTSLLTRSTQPGAAVSHYPTWAPAGYSLVLSGLPHYLTARLRMTVSLGYQCIYNFITAMWHSTGWDSRELLPLVYTGTSSVDKSTQSRISMKHSTWLFFSKCLLVDIFFANLSISLYSYILKRMLKYNNIIIASQIPQNVIINRHASSNNRDVPYQTSIGHWFLLSKLLLLIRSPSYIH